MRVTVLLGEGLSVSGANSRELEKLLAELGYRARLRVLPPSVDYFSYISDSRHRAQIGPVGWVSDFPAPAGLLGLFRCDAFVPATPGQINYSEFCDPRTERLAQRASRLPAGDPGADRLWAAVDKRVTDQAAVVPLVSPKAIFLLSRRAGHFQYSRQWGVLYEQLWVR
jgi:peptide/nickel transport system substrate-binding protein